MNYDLISVKYLQNYFLELVFADGTKGTVDFFEYVKKGGVFSAFNDLDFFKKVFVHPELKVLTWPNDIDIAPETVYAKAIGKEF